MKAFEWANATSFDDAVKLLGNSGEKTNPDELPRPMGGGQDLLTTMKSYITTPPRVVNLRRSMAREKSRPMQPAGSPSTRW